MSNPRSNRPATSSVTKNSKNNNYSSGPVPKPVKMMVTVKFPTAAESKAKSLPITKSSKGKKKTGSPPAPNDVTATVSVPVSETTSRSQRKVIQKTKNAISFTEEKPAHVRAPRKKAVAPLPNTSSPMPNTVTTTVSIPIASEAQLRSKNGVPLKIKNPNSTYYSSQVQPGPKPDFPPPPATSASSTVFTSFVKTVPAAPMPPKMPSPIPPPQIPFFRPPLPPKPKPLYPPGNTPPIPLRPEKPIMPRILKNTRIPAVEITNKNESQGISGIASDNNERETIYRQETPIDGEVPIIKIPLNLRYLNYLEGRKKSNLT